MSQLQRIIITPEQIQHDVVELTREQSHYLKRVLRLKAGDRFIANAPDHPWLAALTNADSEADSDVPTAQLLEALPPNPPLPVHIHLIAALPKTGFDEVVRQSTELGVGTIWPVLSDRTLLKPSPKKLQRWQRIAEEATEQCERAAVPVVQEPRKFAEAIAQIQANPRYICAARGETQHLLVHLQNHQKSHQDSTDPLSPSLPASTIAIAIGPEGGWSECELDQAITHHYTPISLGPTILRAVTAPLAAIALILGHYSTKA